MLALDPLSWRVAKRFLGMSRVAREYQRRRHGLEPVEHDDEDGQGGGRAVGDGTLAEIGDEAKVGP